MLNSLFEIGDVIRSNRTGHLYKVREIKNPDGREPFIRVQRLDSDFWMRYSEAYLLSGSVVNLSKQKTEIDETYKDLFV